MNPVSRPLLVVAEGVHDVKFLKTISAVLNDSDSDVPSLADGERRGEIVFLANGGVSSPEQAQQLAWLGCSRFHLIDREVPPETVYRENTATALNALPDCVAFVTGKRSLENYLHPQAILEARGVAVSFGDDEDVGSLVARELHQRRDREFAWEDLDRRTRKRLRNRAKRWLNAEAAGRMTPELLAERDPEGEVRGWLAVIAKLTGGE